MSNNVKVKICEKARDKLDDLKQKHLYYRVYSIPPPLRGVFIDEMKDWESIKSALKHDVLLVNFASKIHIKRVGDKKRCIMKFYNIPLTDLVPEDVHNYYSKYLSIVDREIRKTWRNRGFKLKFKVEKLIIGIGEKGPLDMGLVIHPIFGLPYIPGSSLKGVFRTFFNVISYYNRNMKLNREELFGSQKRAGILIFTDALPTLEEGELYLDVINPHQKIGPSTKIELDETQNPAPVAILSIKDATFTSYILIDVHERLAQNYKSALKNVLGKVSFRGDENPYGIFFSIGAKTSSGYGRISHMNFEWLEGT